MARIASSARRASQSEAMTVLARFGLAARAFVYLVIGWLAVQIARGHGSHQANQRGALSDIAQHSYGIVLLWILGVGFWGVSRILDSSSVVDHAAVAAVW